MANPTQLKRSIKTLEQGAVQIMGSFAPQGTSAPTTEQGSGFSISRTGVGTFLITLDKTYEELVAAVGSVQLSSAADMDVQFGDWTQDSSGSSTLVLRTQAGATETDISADANNRVHFNLTLKQGYFA